VRGRGRTQCFDGEPHRIHDVCPSDVGEAIVLTNWLKNDVKCEKVCTKTMSIARILGQLYRVSVAAGSIGFVGYAVAISEVGYVKVRPCRTDPPRCQRGSERGQEDE